MAGLASRAEWTPVAVTSLSWTVPTSGQLVFDVFDLSSLPIPAHVLDSLMIFSLKPKELIRVLLHKNQFAAFQGKP